MSIVPPLSSSFEASFPGGLPKYPPRTLGLSGLDEVANNEFYPVVNVVDEAVIAEALAQSDWRTSEEELNKRCKEMVSGAFTTLETMFGEMYQNDPLTLRRLVQPLLGRPQLPSYTIFRRNGLEERLKDAFFSHFRAAADILFLSLRREVVKEVLALPRGMDYDDAKAVCLALAGQVVDRLRAQFNETAVAKDTPVYAREHYLKRAADYNKPELGIWKEGEGLGGYFLDIYRKRPSYAYIDELQGEPEASFTA